MLLIKVKKKIVVFIYCTEQLNLKNISYWHYFMTKIMSICPIWNFTLYVTQSSFFWKSPRCSLTFEFMILILANDFSCYLCSSLCIKFHVLIEPNENHEHLYSTNIVCLFVWWCLTQLSTIFQLYVAVSFIGGGNRRTLRKPPTWHKSLTNFIT